MVAFKPTNTMCVANSFKSYHREELYQTTDQIEALIFTLLLKYSNSKDGSTFFSDIDVEECLRKWADRDS